MHLILVARYGANQLQPSFHPAGTRSQTLEQIIYPRVFIPRTVHKQVYIEITSKKIIGNNFTDLLLDVRKPKAFLICWPNPHLSPHHFT